MLTLHNVVILIKSVFNKDQNHYFYYIFFEKCSYQLSQNRWQMFFDTIIMLRSGEKKVAKEEFYVAKKNKNKK